MRRSTKPILIASRRSRLAKIQTEKVGNALAKLHPTLDVSYLWVESEGDRQTQKVLAESGGKGLFCKSIEMALLDRRADVAVHSLKDLPVQEMTKGLTLAAITRRADVRDCLLSRSGASSIEQLAQGAVLGTASPRRAAQVLMLRPDIKIKLLRGNVETRISKVLDSSSENNCEATLLAKAGLVRLKMQEHAKTVLPVEKMLPCAGQGALAIQCRADDHTTLTRLMRLNDPDTASCVNAERRIVAALDGDCHSPIAVLVQRVVDESQPESQDDLADKYRLFARVMSPDGSQCLEEKQTSTAADLSRAADGMAGKLLSDGAEEILKQAQASAIIA